MIPLSLNCKVVCITASDRASGTGSLGISCKAGSLGRSRKTGSHGRFPDTEAACKAYNSMKHRMNFWLTKECYDATLNQHSLPVVVGHSPQLPSEYSDLAHHPQAASPQMLHPSLHSWSSGKSLSITNIRSHTTTTTDWPLNWASSNMQRKDYQSTAYSYIKKYLPTMASV